jgi:hypothetical protein
MTKLFKYLPDVIIQLGIFFLAKETFLPTSVYHISIFYDSTSSQYKISGVMLISIGINIVIRKYLQGKKWEK